MVPISMNFNLPEPWKNKQFSCNRIGFLNFLVGPNATGKTRFALDLMQFLPKPRFLSADRLAGFFGQNITQSALMVQSNIRFGFEKREFESYKNTSSKTGLGGDAFVILEEKLDIRIRVEATLSQIFDRRIRLEWDSGRLIPQIYSKRTGNSYRIIEDECHGLKELMILLTHLYDDHFESLIIDEPELNLHPQFQSYFIQEVRRIAGNPHEEKGKKLIFLITHSPTILDINSVQDLSSIICFHYDFEPPSHLFDFTENQLKQFESIVSRLNVHHKLLFFSSYPVFVEGIFDAQLVKAIQNKRGISVEGIGSCVIDVGGCEELSLYFRLCKALRKKAFFIYDLDALFRGGLRRNAGSDERVLDFLAEIGAGDDFQKTCGEFEHMVFDQIKAIRKSDTRSREIEELKKYLDGILTSPPSKDELRKARVAFLIHLHRFRPSLLLVIEERQIKLIETRFSQIIESLKRQHVYVLSHGAIEHYLPCYSGNIYELSETSKKNAIINEIEWLSQASIDVDLAERYGELFTVIEFLPSAPKVDPLKVIEEYLSSLIYKVHTGIINGNITDLISVEGLLGQEWNSYNRVFEIRNLQIVSTNEFSYSILVRDLWGRGELSFLVDQDTNPMLGHFNFQNRLKTLLSNQNHMSV